MSQLATAPDIANLDIPIDAWTQPFWDAAKDHRLVMPCCGNCRRFRWPPGPFCPGCQSQVVEWLPAGTGSVYSFTIVPDGAGGVHVPALIEFPSAGRQRLLAPIVDTTIASIHIGASVTTHWRRAANATVPVFAVERSDGRQ